MYAQALSASDIGRLLGDMGRLLGELLRASRAQDLHACRRVCGIPASVTRKDDLINEFTRRSEHPPEHKAILTHVLSGMTTEAMRRWVSMMRKLGHAVPPAKVMGRNRAEVMSAIICSDRLGATGSSEPQTCVGESGGQQPDPGMALVVFDNDHGVRRARRRLHKRWSKLARRAALPGRIRRILAEMLDDDPDTTVAALREAVGEKVGVSLVGKYQHIFERHLLRLTAKPEQQRRPRQRFVLAVGRRRKRSNRDRA